MNAVYAVEIRGQAGPLSAYSPFAVPAEVHVVQAIEPAPSSTNGANPLEVGIFTSANPLAGTAGALFLGTNTALSSVTASDPSSAVDVAFVRADSAVGTLDATIDRNVFALPAARVETFNVYSVSGGTAHILAGTVTLRFADGGRSLSGSLLLGGSGAFDGGVTSQYSATFTGALLR